VRPPSQGSPEGQREGRCRMTAHPSLDRMFDGVLWQGGYPPRVPLVTAQVVDTDNAEQFPEIAIARAYSRGETPSPELIARADERGEA